MIQQGDPIGWSYMIILEVWCKCLTPTSSLKSVTIQVWPSVISMCIQQIQLALEFACSINNTQSLVIQIRVWRCCILQVSILQDTTHADSQLEYTICINPDKIKLYSSDVYLSRYNSCWLSSRILKLTKLRNSVHALTLIVKQNLVVPG